MRNQWPRNKKEIRFKKSLFRFLVSLGLVFVLGLVARFSLQSIPLEEKILSEIKVPEGFEFKLDQPEIRFRSGLLPVIGLWVNRVEVFRPQCPLRKLTAQNLLLRLDPWSLLLGQVQPGRLGVDFVEASYSKKCPGQKTVAESSSKPITPASSNPVEVRKGKRLPPEWLENLFSEVGQALQTQPLKSVLVDQIKVIYFKKFDEPVRMEGSLYAHVGKKLFLNLNLKEFAYEKKQLNFLSSRLAAEVDASMLALRVLSKVREGKVTLDLEVKNEQAKPASVKIKLDKIPVSALASGFFPHKEIRYLWISCEAGSESSWETLLNRKLELGECKMDGPYGEVAVHELDTSLSRMNRAKLEVKNVQLDKIFDNKRDLYFSGVFSEYGIKSGDVNFDSGQFEISGQLKNSSFIFSNNNLRDIQKIENIPFKIHADKHNASFEVRDVKIDKGQFEGELVVEKLGDDINGRVAVHRLRLDPKIYKLMIRSKPSDLKAYGKFVANTREGIQNWSVILGTPHLESEYYEFRNLKVKAEGEKQGLAKVKLTVGEGALNQSSPLFTWLAPTLLEKEWAAEKIGFKELSTFLDIGDDRSVKWSRGYISLANGWQLSTEGVREAGRKVTAWLQWDRPDRRYLRWDYEGSFFKGRWVPKTEWVKSWLLANPKFLEKHSSINFPKPEESRL